MSVLLILAQVVLGLYFIVNGVNHFMKAEMIAGYAKSRGLGAGKFLTILSGIALVFSGLGVVLGIYVVWSLSVLVLFLLLTAFLIHHFWTDQDPMQRMGEQVNFMKNIALASSLLLLTGLVDAWPWSLLL